MNFKGTTFLSLMSTYIPHNDNHHLSKICSNRKLHRNFFEPQNTDTEITIQNIIYVFLLVLLVIVAATEIAYGGKLLKKMTKELKKVNMYLYITVLFFQCDSYFSTKSFYKYSGFRWFKV